MCVKECNGALCKWLYIYLVGLVVGKQYIFLYFVYLVLFYMFDIPMTGILYAPNTILMYVVLLITHFKNIRYTNSALSGLRNLMHYSR